MVVNLNFKTAFLRFYWNIEKLEINGLSIRHNLLVTQQRLSWSISSKKIQPLANAKQRD